MATADVTIGILAKTSGLARSTLLYYDRLGLLRPSG
ncbi:MAG: MerR family DNA-binding transcriptional regulator, partial [Planctomycetota bacterium]